MTAHPEVIDRHDAIAERREELVAKRADELIEKRLANNTMSKADLALAFEMLSTRTDLLDVIHDSMNTNDSMFGAAVFVTARVCIRMNCMDEARAEMGAFFSDPTSRERH